MQLPVAAVDVHPPQPRGELMLRISTAGINLYINAPDTMSAGRSYSFTTEAGEATLHLEVRAEDLSQRWLAEVDETLCLHPGDCDVYLYIVMPDGSRQARRSSRARIACGARPRRTVPHDLLPALLGPVRPGSAPEHRR